MSEKIQNFIDKLATGDNAGAGEAFKDALRDKVATSLDAARQDIAGRIFAGTSQKLIATLNRQLLTLVQKQTKLWTRKVKK